MKLSVVAVVALMLTACLDSVGPRPRPGGTNQGPPPPEQPELQYFEMQPRVISQGLTDSVRVTVHIAGDAEIVDIDTRAGYLVGLPKTGDGVYSGNVAASILLFGYRNGDLHNPVGVIEVSANGVTNEYGMIVNVKDGTVPTVDPVSVISGMQVTPHVVNIRYDSLYLGGGIPTAPLKTFYSQYADEYTFAALISQVETQADHSFTLVHNDISGIGLPLSNNSARYGSAGALEGIIAYPGSAAFDPAETSNLRDIAHRWMNYLRRPSLATADAQWPLSDLANGVVGWTDPETHQQFTFPFDIEYQQNGTYLVHLTDTPRTFNDLELYLMGLLAPDSVQPHVVFLNQNQRSQLRNTGVLQGPVDSVRIGNILAQEGVRVPAAGSAPHSFKMVTIVLSRGGALSRDEMSFFEHMAARAEAITALPYFNGQIRSTTLPFFSATNGRATLSTRLGLR